MTQDLSALKAAVPLRQLVEEDRVVDRFGKALCPAHDDHTPSCHIYDDHFFCYACHARGDHIDWLRLVHGIDTAQTIAELERRAGGYVPATVLKPVRRHRAIGFREVDARVLERHHEQAAQLARIPASMTGRGFTLDDLKRLGFMAYREDAVFPVPGPDGKVLGLKRRLAKSIHGQRYRYTTKGHGTPAWCSPGFLEREKVLVIEGELNGMACWLAAPEMAVMGVAGAGGKLHPGVFEGRVVCVYADGDEVGQNARADWASEALKGRASAVYLLEPWKLDACDIAGRYGRERLRELLAKKRESFGAVEPFSAPNIAPKELRLGESKPYLGFWGNRFSSGPNLGGKPCLW